MKDLLTLMRIERAPEIQNTFLSGEHRIIKSFMRKYKKYLRMKLYQQALEPIYNRLFEYIQQQHDHHSELVWSLGHARLLKDGKHINGPLLDILVEVSLAPDGALLVKPREHAGVALNRQIVSALTASSSDWGASSGHSILTQLHRTVAELEPTQFSPAQPATYASTLKRIAVELSPGGSFQSSSNSRKKSSSKLVVSEAWCLYTRLKPSSVWARDATSLAGQLMLPASSKFVTPQAAWSLTHGPNVLEKVLDSRAAAIERDRSKGGIFGWFRNTSNQSVAEANSKSQRPLFPLATSDSQNRIADLLLNQNYPAVVTEGPPGTG